MRFLGKLFGGSGGGNESENGGAEATLTCVCCGCEIEDEEAMREGMCEECCDTAEWTKYCCGAIYEDGEDTCRSCGEPI